MKITYTQNWCDWEGVYNQPQDRPQCGRSSERPAIHMQASGAVTQLCLICPWICVQGQEKSLSYCKILLDLIFIFWRRLSWSDGDGKGFSLEYPAISLHAICRDTSQFQYECIYCMMDSPLDGKNYNRDANLWKSKIWRLSLWQYPWWKSITSYPPPLLISIIWSIP